MNGNNIFDKAYINEVIEDYNNYGSVLNDVLYKLCEDNFGHEKPNSIIAKTQLIGRTYAVALERQRDKEQINDDFYSDKVVRAFQESNLDEELQILKKETELTIPVLLKALQTHKILVDKLSTITRGGNRSTHSFCSKYLHFHLPHLFFIYDGRAKDALSALTKEYQIIVNDNVIKYDNNVHTEYAKFAHKCYYLLLEINKQISPSLTLRQLDNLFLKVANDKLKAKRNFINL